MIAVVIKRNDQNAVIDDDKHHTGVAWGEKCSKQSQLDIGKENLRWWRIVRVTKSHRRKWLRKENEVANGVKRNNNKKSNKDIETREAIWTQNIQTQQPICIHNTNAKSIQVCDVFCRTSGRVTVITRLPS